jgi:phosphoglycerol transferase
VQTTQTQGNYWREFAWCTAAVVASLLAVCWVMKLWRADFHVPFLYTTDTPLTLTWIKGIMDNGWYLHNRYLGAPLGQDLHDFPMDDGLNFLLVKLLALICHDVGMVHNVFYILGFPLAALTAFLVLRHFKISPLPALVAGVLFTCLPSHFLRLGHLFLSAYYLIPPLMMIVLWIYLGAGPFFTGHDSERRRPALWNGKTLLSLVICLLASSQGVYYAFFGCFFLLVAGLASTLNRRALYPLCSALLLIGVISLGLLANLAPSLLYHQVHGLNPEVAHRYPLESEEFALKLTQMVVPIAGHRIPFLAHLRRMYDESWMPLVNENSFAVLGLTGSIGLFLLLGRLLLWKKTGSGPDLQSGLSMFAVLAILLATIGGFSALFSVYITPQIRGWNRISLHIGFCSLFGLAQLCERWLQTFCLSSTRRWFAHAALGAVLVLGLLDQTSKTFIPNYKALKAQYRSDRDFVRRIEASAPPGAMIFQLPYFPFPETGVRAGLVDYEPLKGYLHSRKLRWSHGSMKGREGDVIIRSISVQPLPSMLEALAAAGFSGIYLDRQGYADRGAAIEAQLTHMLSAPPLVSEDQKRAYFSLLDYGEELRHSLPAAEWESARRQVLLPVMALFRDGFSGREQPELPGRWCASEGCVCLYNPRLTLRRVRLDMTVEVRQSLAHLTVRGELLSRAYEIRDGQLSVSEELVVPPGFHPLRLSCDARQVISVGDLRVLVFYVKSFVLKELD